MALDPKFQVTDIESDRTEAILTDTTIYGGENPERIDLAVYVQMYKVNEEGVRTLLTTTPNNANPTVATTWTFALSVDGWYQADIIMIPVYDALETYNEHDLVYSTNVYKSISAAPITGNAPPSAAWTLVSSPTSEVALNGEATGAGNATFFIFNTIMTPNTEKHYGDIIVVEALACVGDCNIEEKVNSYEFIDLLLNAMYIACVRQQFANGEKLARRASQEFNC